MNPIKIGKFIAERRKMAELTQAQLAEKLNITDRAVSKWENGKTMPDSSIMLELCEILGITVNDLLSGEVVTMEQYNKELEKNLLDMIKQKEESDRKFLMLEWVIGILSIIVLFIPILIAAYVQMDDWLRIVLICSGFIPALVGFAVAMRIEQVAGYYKCAHCGHTYIPTAKAMYMSMHMGRTRYMTCPKCGKKSWQKKVVKKD